MTNLNRPARLNRVVLGVIGLVLLAAGGLTLAIHFGQVRAVSPATPLAPSTTSPPTWTLYVTVVTAIVLGLLVLRWLLAQLTRRPKSHTWRFESDLSSGTTELAADAAVAPFTAEVRAMPGVHQVTATLAGTQESPVLALLLVVDQGGDPSEIRGRMETEALPRLRESLDLEQLPVSTELRVSSSAAGRVA